MIIVKPIDHIKLEEFQNQVGDFHIDVKIAWTEVFNGRYGIRYIIFLGFESEEDWLKFKLVNTDKWVITDQYPKTWGWDGNIDF